MRRRLVVLVLVMMAGLAPASPARAQTNGPERRSEGGLVERIGFDSLGDIPWDAFVVALSISAAIGAAGGVIYAGLRGSDDD